MKRTSSHLVIVLSTLGVLLGAALLLTAVQPAVAEPVGVTPLPPVAQTDGRAGACYSFYHHPEGSSQRPFLPLAYDAGSRWDRFDFSWPRLEPTNGVWSDTVRSGYDSLVHDLDAAGIDMVGILLWTPDWAATGGVQGLGIPSFNQRLAGWYTPVPRAPGAVDGLSTVAISATSPPQGLYEEWNDWTDADGDPINYWGRFVHAVVTRYGDRVTHWEVWNEPEWSYFWTGTSADYTQLLKVGYQATKAACSDCQVLFGGLHYWMDTSYYRSVLGRLAQDPAAPANNYFFDAMSVHLYSRSSGIYDEVQHIRDGMAAYDVGDHPIWLTETGVPVWNDGAVDPDPVKYDFAATQDEAAAYVIQSYANGWASGIERYLFFRTHDENMGEYFGLVRNDYSLRPSYVAYQVVATYLISPTFVTRGLTDVHRNVTLWDTPHGKVSVLWNEGPATSVYTLPAALPTATLVDRLGVTETITATNGVYTFTLPGATANLASNPADYYIGGDPLVVIEAEVSDEPPTSTVDALPATVYTTTSAVTWQGHDDESGVWFYDVQVRDGESGEWGDWQLSMPLTSSQFSGQHAHTYYFRSRAIDGVGNREDWPIEPQAHMAFDLASTFYFTVGTFFADEDRDTLWGTPITETNEITLTGVTLQLLDAAGQDVVSPTVGSTFTATVFAGQSYQVWATITDYVRILPFSCPLGGQVYTQTHAALGLVPVTRVYLPVVIRDAVAPSPAMVALDAGR